MRAARKLSCGRVERRGIASLRRRRRDAVRHRVAATASRRHGVAATPRRPRRLAFSTLGPHLGVGREVLGHVVAQVGGHDGRRRLAGAQSEIVARARDCHAHQVAVFVNSTHNSRHDRGEPVWKSTSKLGCSARAATGTTSRRWRGIVTPSRRRSNGSTSHRWRGAPAI